MGCIKSYKVIEQVSCLFLYIYIYIYPYTYSRNRKGTRVIEPVDVLLVEGTLVLYQKELCDLMFMKVFIDEDSDERLARRVRKTKVRNGHVLTIKELLVEYVEKVKPMYEEYILPVKSLMIFALLNFAH